MEKPLSRTNHEGRSRAVGFGACALVLALGEIALCFVGPLSFFRKPTLMLFPLYSSGLSETELTEVTEYLERQLALTRSYSIVGHRMIVEYYVRTDPDFDRTKIQTVDLEKARAIAGELGMERFATGWVYQTANRCELDVSIWDLSGQGALRQAEFAARSLKGLLAGVGADGGRFDFRSALGAPTKGVGMTEAIVLLVFALQALVGLIAIGGRVPSFLVEIVWAALSVLFLFTYIYATNANMDYMQRYIATTGTLRLAENTSLERLYSILRYSPSLLLLGAGWLGRTIRQSRGSGHDGRLPAASSGAVSDRVYLFVRRWPFVLTILSAGLFGLSFPSLVSLEGFGPLAWIALVPLHLVLMALEARRAIFHGVYFGILQTLFINYWHGTYDYVTLHMISIAMIVEYLVFMIVLIVLLRTAGKWGFVIAPLAWVLFDWGRSSGALAYPWGIAGTSQYRFLPFIQIASITGIWGLDFLVFLANASISWFIGGRFFGWRWNLDCLTAHLRPRVRRLIELTLPLTLGGILLGGSLVAGASILAHVSSRIEAARTGDPMNIVLVQPNVDPRKNPYVDNLDLLISLTDDAIKRLGKKPDLIAWPEGSFLLDIRYWTDPERSDSYWGRVVRRFLEYQRSLGTWLATGTQDHGTAAEQGRRVAKNFNSSILLAPDGLTSGIYHKMHLVPFGEYFPLSKVRFKQLYDQFKKYDISDWGLGEERYIFQHPRAPYATPICFEDVFPDHVRRFVAAGAKMIVNMSNDYWSLSPVEGRQHGILALFRAVENHRPFLRATASGYTVSIEPTGRIEAGSPAPYTAGTLTARVPMVDLPMTPYTRWGDWFPLLAGIILGLFAVVALLRMLVLRPAARIQGAPTSAQARAFLRSAFRLRPCPTARGGTAPSSTIR